MNAKIYLYIGIMALVTYLIRGASTDTDPKRNKKTGQYAPFCTMSHMSRLQS